MVTTPQPTDSAASPASATPAPLPSHAPQAVQPAAPVANVKPQATPAKRARKPALKTTANTPASPQPPIKQAAAQKTPASPVPASKNIVKASATSIALKLAASEAAAKATAAKPAARKAPASKTTPQKTAPLKPTSARAVAPKVATPATAVASKPATPASTAKKTPAAKPKKEVKKEKLVRDSFTIPKSEFAVLDQLKRRAGVIARSVKKSELLRAGIKLLAGLSNDALLSALSQVPTIKTGRPALKK